MPSMNVWALPPDECIHRRERVQIRRPNDDCLSTFIKDIEMINRGRKGSGVCFSLPAIIAPENIPAGSELWLERDGKEPLAEKI